MVAGDDDHSIYDGKIYENLTQGLPLSFPFHTAFTRQASLLHPGMDFIHQTKGHYEYGNDVEFIIQ